MKEKQDGLVRNIRRLADMEDPELTDFWKLLGYRDAITPRIQRAEGSASDRWLLLFQLDTVECGGFELMFGDCGHIYFYITKEDLAARRFDRIWLILQCY